MNHWFIEIDMGQRLEGIIVLALAGKDAGSLLDGAKFLGTTDAFLALEVLAIGSEGAGIVLEIVFAVVPEVGEDTDAQPLIGSERKSGLQVGLGGGTVFHYKMSPGTSEGGGTDLGEGPS